MRIVENIGLIIIDVQKYYSLEYGILHFVHFWGSIFPPQSQEIDPFSVGLCVTLWGELKRRRHIKGKKKASLKF